MTSRRAAAGLAAVALALVACGEEGDAPGVVECTRAIPRLVLGLGAPGPERSITRTLPNPRWPALEVSLHLPRSASPSAPVPVVLFAHANDVGDPASYSALIDHVTSRGMALVFSPYMVGTKKHRDRYEALWSGFEAAQRLTAKCSTSPVWESSGTPMAPAPCRISSSERWATPGGAHAEPSRT